MNDWSFQLYSARNHPPLSNTLQLLAEPGYTQVEGFGGLYDQAASLRQDLDSNGLTMPTGHFGLSQLEDLDQAMKTIETLGVQTVICPHLAADQRPSDAAGCGCGGSVACHNGAGPALVPGPCGATAVGEEPVD